MTLTGIAGFPQTALADIGEALRKYRIALLFGWQDIRQRYRRSRIGVFWLTINQVVLIAALGLIFGALFRASMVDFLPHIAAGLIFWTFISGTISEGCKCFISSQSMILQVRLPLFTHVMRLIWKEIIILAHNVVIIPVILIFYMKNPGWAVLLFPLGFVLVVVNLFWIVLVLGTACTRYRDLPQVVQNVIQVAFYMTPIMWTEETLPPRLAGILLDFSPFYHLLSLMRKPLLGEVPAMESYIVAVALALVGWTFALFFYGRYRWRVPYWL